MTNNDKIKIFNLIILDKSGSMSVIRNAAVEGFNEVVEGIRIAQKESEVQEHYVSLLPFCSCPMEYIYNCTPIEEVRDLTLQDYRPCCYTPLFDAMGKALNDMLKRVEEEKHSAVVVTIITDGEENSSREYNSQSIKTLVDKLQKEYNWKFSYIGTNQDVEAVAKSMAINDSRHFEYNDEGMRYAMACERTGRSRVYFSIEDDFRNDSSKFSFEPFSKTDDNENSDKKDDVATDDLSVNNITGREKRIRMMLEKLRGNNNRTTPGNISFLENNQIFVFGSNEQGLHSGGAALTAVKKFGAIMGQGEGLQGQSYAIPTMEGIDSMRKAINRFIEYAKEHPELTFLVTRIGCGIAGYKEEEVAPLFADAKDISNIYLPREFWNKIN